MFVCPVCKKKMTENQIIQQGTCSCGERKTKFKYVIDKKEEKNYKREMRFYNIGGREFVSGKELADLNIDIIKFLEEELFEKEEQKR